MKIRTLEISTLSLFTSILMTSTALCMEEEDKLKIHVSKSPVSMTKEKQETLLFSNNFEAVEHYRKADFVGKVDVQLKLAQMYEQGRGG